MDRVECKLKSFKGASSQLDPSRSNAEMKTGMLKEHHVTKNSIKQDREANNTSLEAMRAVARKKEPDPIVGSLLGVFEPVRVQESTVCQVQVARDVDKREGVGGKTNTLPEKVERKVVKAGRRADGCLIASLIQTRIDGFLKLSDNVANKGITKKRKQGNLGEKLKPTSNKKMKN